MPALDFVPERKDSAAPEKREIIAKGSDFGSPWLNRLVSEEVTDHWSNFTTFSFRPRNVTR
jgi:hypothetical protein